MADTPYGTTVSIHSFDGYIEGQTVFADANHNGLLDNGEASAITDALGSATLYNAVGNIIGFGGTDTSTHVAFTGTLEAPEGSTVLSPLTTLVSLLLPDNPTAAQITAAEQTVVKGLGLSLTSGQSLLTLDAVAGAISGDASAGAVYVAGVKVLDTLKILSAGLSSDAVTASGSVSDANASNSVFQALADQLTSAAASGQPVDLTDTVTLGNILSSAASAAGVTLDPAAANSVTAIASASNVALDDAAAKATSGQDLLVGASAVGQVAQGDTSQAIQNLNEGQSVSAVETQYTGDNLNNAVSDASGSVDLPGAGTGNLVLQLSGDQYQGNPHFQVYVDGNLVTGQLSGIAGQGTANVADGISANHAKGEWQAFTVSGDFDPNAPHQVEVRFLDDVYGGGTNDRNLYVGDVTLSGASVSTSTNANPSPLYNTGSVTLSTPPVALKDTLAIQLSGDQYLGNPHFQVFVDGVAVNGELSGIGGSGTVSSTDGVSASHASGQYQTYTVKGNFDSNVPHQVEVRFLDDVYGGPNADRNLYVGNVTLNGEAVGTSTNSNPAPLYNEGSVNLTTGTGGGADTLAIHLSGDQYLGNPHFQVLVDGAVVNGELSGIGGAGTVPSTDGVSASQGAGQYQTYTVKGNFDPNLAHKVEVRFLDDAYGGPNADRNLYVGTVTINGQSVTTSTDANPTPLYNSGSVALTTGMGAGPDGLQIQLSGDQYLGNPHFQVLVDGVAVSGQLSALDGTGSVPGTDGVSASHDAGQYQTYSVNGSFDPSVAHKIEVRFLDDAYGGPNADRNLYVGNVTLNGEMVGTSTNENPAPLYNTGSLELSTPASSGAGMNAFALTASDTLTGGMGFDTLSSGSEHATFYGAQYDLQTGVSGDTLIGGMSTGASDTLYGGAGNDLLAVSHGNNVLHGTVGFDTLQGGDGLDTLYGGGHSELHAGSGGNFLYGGYSSTAMDTLYGGAGNDTLAVYQGNNQLHAFGGNDTLSSGTGNDTLFGSTGDDTFVIGGQLGHDTIIGGGGLDKISITDHAGADALYQTNADGSTTIAFGSSQSVTVDGAASITFSDGTSHKLS